MTGLLAGIGLGAILAFIAYIGVIIWIVLGK